MPRRASGVRSSRSSSSRRSRSRRTCTPAPGSGTRFSGLRDLVWPARPVLPPTAVSSAREFGLENDLDRLPGELPYGRRRLVGIARAMASAPSVLLLDEPAAGLDDRETSELGDLVRRFADQYGMAVLLIEHDVELVLRVCDRIVVRRLRAQDRRGHAGGDPQRSRRHRRVPG